jgi:hypothetical protein
VTTAPSRFNATPAEINRFLRQHFAEDVLLRHQQRVGREAVAEAAADLFHRSLNPTVSDEFREGLRYAAGYLDSPNAPGPWPSEFVKFMS